MAKRKTPFLRGLVPLLVLAASLSAVLLFLLDPYLFHAEPSPAPEDQGEEIAVEGIEAPFEEPADRKEDEAVEEIEAPPLEPAPVEKEEESILPPLEYGARGFLVDLSTGRMIRDLPFFVEAYAPTDPRGVVRAEVALGEGEFFLPSLRFGTYSIWAVAEGYAPFFGALECPREGRVALGLVPAGRVRIRITDAYARRLSRVAIQDLSKRDPCAPDLLIVRPEGGYQVVGGVKRGLQTLAVGAPRFDYLRMEVEFTPGEERSYWAVLE